MSADDERDETLEEWVKRQVDAAPPLTDEQRHELARLLAQPTTPPTRTEGGSPHSDEKTSVPADRRDAATELRAWGRGDLPMEAAVEILAGALNGRLLSGQWVRHEDDGRAWFDVERVAEGGYLSGGERRVLDIAASLAGDHPVVLRDVIPGLDWATLTAVLDALAHAGGLASPTDIEEGDRQD